MAELARELAYLPPDQMMLLAHGERAKAYSASPLGNWFRDRCEEAGLPHCSAHGLRKAGARRLAEAGATEWEVMAFLAHRTAKEARPLYRCGESGDAHDERYGETQHETRTNLVQPSVEVGQIGGLSY